MRRWSKKKEYLRGVGEDKESDNIRYLSEVGFRIIVLKHYRIVARRYE